MSQKWSKASWAQVSGRTPTWGKGGWGQGNFQWRRTSQPWPKQRVQQVPRQAPRQYNQPQVPQQQVSDLIDFDLPDTSPPIQVRDPTAYFTPNKPDPEFPNNSQLYNCKDPFFQLVHYFPTIELEGMSQNPEANIEGMKADFKYNCVVITSILHTLNLKKIDTAEMYQRIQPYVVENIRLYQAICWLTNALYKFPKPDEAFCGMVQWHPKQSFDLYEIYFYDSFDSAFKVANSGRNEFDFDSAEDFIKNWQVMFRIDYTNLPGDVQKMKDTKLLWDKIAERTNLQETNDDDEYDSESEFVK